MGLVALRHVWSSRTRARTHVPCIGRRILNHCATREVPVFILFISTHWEWQSWAITWTDMRYPPKGTAGSLVSIWFLGPFEKDTEAAYGAHHRGLIIRGGEAERGDTVQHGWQVLSREGAGEGASAWRRGRWDGAGKQPADNSLGGKAGNPQIVSIDLGIDMSNSDQITLVKPGLHFSSTSWLTGEASKMAKIQKLP